MKRYLIDLINWFRGKEKKATWQIAASSPDPDLLAVAAYEIKKHFLLYNQPYCVSVVHDDAWELIDFWRNNGCHICLEADNTGELLYIIYTLPQQQNQPS